MTRRFPGKRTEPKARDLELTVALSPPPPPPEPPAPPAESASPAPPILVTGPGLGKWFAYPDPIEDETVSLTSPKALTLYGVLPSDVVTWYLSSTVQTRDESYTLDTDEDDATHGFRAETIWENSESTVFAGYMTPTGILFDPGDGYDEVEVYAEIARSGATITTRTVTIVNGV